MLIMMMLGEIPRPSMPASSLVRRLAVEVRDLVLPMLVQVQPKLRVDRDIIVRVLAHLRLVDTDQFGLLARAKSEIPAREEMHRPQNDRGDDEGIGETGDRVGELVAQLDVVVIDPATWDDGSIQSSNGGLGEEAGEEVTNDTTNSVRGKDLSK